MKKFRLLGAVGTCLIAVSFNVQCCTDQKGSLEKTRTQPGKWGMLILTRRMGEMLMVGDDVTVTVLGVRGNQVRIGINAPRDVAVHREEIYERIKTKEHQGSSTN